MAQSPPTQAVQERTVSRTPEAAQREAPAAAACSTRACPTRADGGSALFQHRVTVAQCQSKQRGLYHKCFTCAHANGRG